MEEIAITVQPRRKSMSKGKSVGKLKAVIDK